MCKPLVIVWNKRSQHWKTRNKAGNRLMKTILHVPSIICLFLCFKSCAQLCNVTNWWAKKLRSPEKVAVNLCWWETACRRSECRSGAPGLSRVVVEFWNIDPLASTLGVSADLLEVWDWKNSVSCWTMLLLDWTAPKGHTLRLLALPRFLDGHSWWRTSR